MPSYLGSYPISSVNPLRYGKHNQGVSLLWDTSVDIKNLPPSKYKSFQVQLTTSALQWVDDTCWSVPLPVLQWHIIPAWIWMSMVYAHFHHSWAPSYLLQLIYQKIQLRSLNNQHSWWTIQLVHTSTVTSHHLHLGIGQVIQSPHLTKKLYSTYQCLPLAWNLCVKSHQHNIACNYNKGLHLV